jgi:hypothetical protein
MRYVLALILILVCTLAYIRYEKPQTWNRYVDAFRAPNSIAAPPPTNTSGNPTNSAADSTNSISPPDAAPRQTPAEVPGHLKPVSPPQPPVLTNKPGSPDLPRD